MSQVLPYKMSDFKRFAALLLGLSLVFPSCKEEPKSPQSPSESPQTQSGIEAEGTARQQSGESVTVDGTDQPPRSNQVDSGSGKRVTQPRESLNSGSSSPSKTVLGGQSNRDSINPAITSEPPPTSLPPRKVGDFELPRIDLVGLSMVMRREVAAAYESAANSAGDPTKIGELGMYYYAVGNALDAIPCFVEATKRQPNELRWWYYLALSYSATYNTDNATSAMEKAIEVDGKFTPAIIELADMIRKAQPDRARELYNRALEIVPKDARVHLGLGEVALQKGEHDKAESHLKDALELAPKYSAANGAMGRLLEATGRSNQAGQYFEIQKAGGQPPLVGDPLIIELLSRAAGGQDLLILAERLARAGQIDKAIRILQKAIQKNESELSVRHALGVLLGIRGMFSEAAREFRTVLQKNPYQFNTMVDLAKALMCLGNYDEAETLLKEVLETGSNEIRAVVLYGNLLLERGRVEHANRYFQGLTKARPDHRESRIALAKALICLEKYDAAIEEYRKAREIDAGEPMDAETFVWELARLMADQQRGIVESAEGIVALRPEQFGKLANGFESAGMKEESKALREFVPIVAKNAALLARAGSFVEAERYAQIGILGHESTQTPQIIELLRKESVSAPDKAGLRHLLALVLSATGHKSEAVVEWRQLLGQKPEFEPAYVAWSVDLLLDGKYAEAQELLKEGLKHRKESALMANALAWALATAPKDADRKPTEAIQWAEFACEKVGYKDPELLDTLAAAYSSAGRFEDAIRTEQEAIKLATQLGQLGTLPDYRNRLSLYNQGIAFREGLRR